MIMKKNSKFSQVKRLYTIHSDTFFFEQCSNFSNYFSHPISKFVKNELIFVVTEK